MVKTMITYPRAFCNCRGKKIKLPHKIDFAGTSILKGDIWKIFAKP